MSVSACVSLHDSPRRRSNALSSGPMSRDHDHDEPKWKYDGVRVVHSNELDINTP